MFRSQNDGTANTITGNVHVSEVSSADFRNVNVTGKMLIHRMAYAESRNTTTFTGSIRVGTRSLFDYRGGAHTGTLDCFQGGPVRSVPGTITPGANCTVF